MNKVIKHKLYSPRRNRYDIKALWNLDCKLAEHIHDALVQFKAVNRHGYPGEAEMSRALWEAVLDKCIWTFQQIAEDYPDDPYNVYMDEYYKFHSVEDDVIFSKSDDGFTKMEFRHEVPAEIWQKRDMYEQCITDGLNLFAKYYRALWD